MDTNITLHQIKEKEKRKKLRELLNKQLEIRKKEREHMLKFVTPIDNNIAILNDVLKSRRLISEYLKNSERLNKWLKDFAESMENKNGTTPKII